MKKNTIGAILCLFLIIPQRSAHTKKVQLKLPEKNTWIYLNRSGKLFSPEQHLKALEIYLKFTWKIQASLAELSLEPAWKTPETNAWTVQAKFLFQLFLPEFYLKFSSKKALKIQVKFKSKHLKNNFCLNCSGIFFTCFSGRFW